MTLNEARNLKVGEKVKTKMYGYVYEVVGLHEHISWTSCKTTIYVRCKDEKGNLMKYKHKELTSIKTTV